MDAMEEQAWQAPMFRKSSLLYLYCVDPEYVSELTVPSLPFLKLKCLFGHVSFPRSLSERRMVVFPQCKRVLEKLKDVVSPCVIHVVSSVEFKIHPDEVEDDGEVMLIWDFDVDKIISVTASQCSVKPSTPSTHRSIDSMPHLDLNRVNCNCSANPSKQGNVLLPSRAATSFNTTAAVATSDFQRLSLSDANEENDPEEEEEEQEDEEEFEDLTDHVNDRDHEAADLIAPENVTVCGVTETLFTESFTLKGSSYHEQFQTTLKNCKEKRINKLCVPVKLSFEPVNRRDENAILVHACPGDSWRPIGYIPGKKVAKVTQAIKNKEITGMQITAIRYQYVFAIKCHKYFASVTISKKGKWMKDKDSYKYNEDI